MTDTNTRTGHWDSVYGARTESALTWFEASAERSLSAVTAFSGPDDPVIDVGGGASRLADGLVAAGYSEITVLDLSSDALALTRDRLGPAGEQVTWIVGDVTRVDLPSTYAVWHDRAAFHFLTDPADQAAYVRQMVAGLRSGGHAIIATFAPDGPETCSNLPVVRYAPEQLAQVFERLATGALALTKSDHFTHVTPKGNRQAFQMSVFRRS
jgi:Methylase involved in ubiquinone/menaquinone biosynthesis